MKATNLRRLAVRWLIVQAFFVSLFPAPARAQILFDVPQSATNAEGIVRFSGQIPTSVEIYAFNATNYFVNNGVTIRGPFEYVGALLGTNTYSTNWTIDVSRWIQKCAGSGFGLIFTNYNSDGPDDPTLTPYQRAFRVSNLELLITPADSHDEAPLILVDAVPTRRDPGSDVVLHAKVSDSDSEITQLEVLDQTNVVLKVDTFLPIGTNDISLTVSNLADGKHQFRIRATSNQKASYSELRPLYSPTVIERPQHRWLGSFGRSKSFYIVDSAGRAHVWGDNSYGQLGLGLAGPAIAHPVTLDPPPGLRFMQITSGGRHAAAVMEDGSLYTWGSNDNGQLGLIGVTFSSTPRKVEPPSPILYFKRVAATDSNTFMLAEDGSLWGFSSSRGFDLVGSVQGLEIEGGAVSYVDILLPNGNVTNSTIGLWRLKPSEVTAWTDFSHDALHELAIGNNGQLYGAGSNNRGQFPTTNAISNYQYNLLSVAGVASWKKVAAGERVNLAEDSQGRLWWWGIGFDEAAPNPNQAKLVPFPKGTTNWLDITVTSTFAMALSEQGELFAWGLATPGTWDDPTAGYAPVPQLVAGLPNLLDPNATTRSATLSQTRLGATGFVTTLVGPRGPLSIEVSTDLQNWTPLTTVTNTSGSVDFTAVTSGGSRFYRIAPATAP